VPAPSGKRLWPQLRARVSSTPPTANFAKISYMTLSPCDIKKYKAMLLNLLALISAHDKQDGDGAIRYDTPQQCPTCGNLDKDFHDHHIVPRSLGGLDAPSNKIKICSMCHSKIHSPHLLTTSALIRAGLDKARKAGKIIGRPRNIRVDDAKVFALRDMGFSYRKIASEIGTTKDVVRGVLRLKALEDRTAAAGSTSLNLVGA